MRNQCTADMAFTMSIEKHNEAKHKLCFRLAALVSQTRAIQEGKNGKRVPEMSNNWPLSALRIYAVVVSRLWASR